MSPQVGRPTNDPKNLNTRIRLSKNDVEKLNYCTEKLGVKNGWVLLPMRAALSGKAMTPGGGIELAAILGKSETVSRINTALKKLGQ